MRKASAVLNTLPTLCMLRILSSTTITGVFSDCRNSFTDFRFNSSMPSLRMGKGKSPLIHFWYAFPILFAHPGPIFYFKQNYLLMRKHLLYAGLLLLSASL